MSKQTKKEEAGRSKFVRLERTIVEDASAFLFALGNQFVSINNAAGALDCFKFSVDLNPRNSSAVYNLGSLFSATGNLEAAYRMYKEASRMSPELLVPKVALAETARKLWKVDEAQEILKEVIKDSPNDYIAASAMALLKYDCGQLAEATEWNERALAMCPGDIPLTLNKALMGMTYGRWRENWPLYEYCLSYNRNERMRHLSMANAWSGQELPGKTLIVVSDQGNGDCVQFSRYLVEARALGKFGKLIYLVQPDLKDLMRRVDGVDEVIGFGEEMEVDYDAYASLLGIMRVLQVSPENCARPPHIRTDPALDVIWKARIDQLRDGSSKKVGIVWSGDWRHGNQQGRSVPLTQLLRLSEVHGVQLVSFQVGVGEKQLQVLPENICMIELGCDFRDFSDTASALKQIDLLISVDTSVPHLAGCIGLPVWLLVANPPEWRSLLDRPDSVWYKNTRIFRQKEPRQWGPVIDAVYNELVEWSNECRSILAEASTT